MKPHHFPPDRRLLAAFMVMAVPALGAWHGWNGWSEPEEEPFDEADLFFELNNTDGDLGIHANIDGEDWKQLWISGPDERVLLQVVARGSMRRHGLTELGFESAEPGFDELSPEEILERFPEGTYEIEATTLENGELESEVVVSHVMPAPPQLSFPLLVDCDEPMEVTAPVTISWQPVTGSHPTIGTPGQPVEVERYEVALETLDDSGLQMLIELPPDVTSFTVPAPFTAQPGTVKFEILVKAENGNRTAEESCFTVN